MDPKPDWMLDSDDDMMPTLGELTAAGTRFALVTLFAADGGPRPVGSQMVVTQERFWGFLSGGCVEADVADHARAALRSGLSRQLTYGHGSPFFDIRLPCGGRIDLLVEPVDPDDPAILGLIDAWQRRHPLRYLSDGIRRLVTGANVRPDSRWLIDRLQEPRQRLVVVGSDPFALAISAAGLQQGWDVTLMRPGGPASPPPQPVIYRTGQVAEVLNAMAPDPWTAIAIATHDADLDQEALLAALGTQAGYVGVLGSRRRLEERRATLLAAGLAPQAMSRLRAPIGLPIGARSPREIAVAVIAEIIERRTLPISWTWSQVATEPQAGVLSGENL